MTRLTWGEIELRNYEYGVDRGVFYPKGGSGYSWDGLVSIKEAATDANQALIYVDGVGHQNQLLIGSFAATIEAFTYPEEFEPYDGYSDIYTGQGRRRFDFSYRTMLDGGHYKIHLVYNALAEPTQRTHSSINSGIDVELFAWDISTRPELVEEARASSHFVIDTRFVLPDILEIIEDRIYGTEVSLSDMPTVADLLAIFWDNALFRVTDNGDGTATIFGPDEAVANIGTDLWRLEWPSVVPVNANTYRLSSF